MESEPNLAIFQGFISALWNRNYFVWFHLRFWLWKVTIPVPDLVPTTHYGSGSASQKVTVPTVPVPQRFFILKDLDQHHRGLPLILGIWLVFYCACSTDLVLWRIKIYETGNSRKLYLDTIFCGSRIGYTTLLLSERSRVGKNSKITQPSGFFLVFWVFFKYLARKGCVYSFKNTSRCTQTLNFDHSYPFS